MSKQIIELSLVQIAETEKAWGVAEDEEHDCIWLPKSQVERDDDTLKITKSNQHKIYTFLVPEWLAMNKGLV